MTFDRPLTPRALDPTNWTGRGANRRYTFASVVAANTRVFLEDPDAGVPDVGPDDMDYSPPPFDLVSTFNKPAAAFRFHS